MADHSVSKWAANTDHLFLNLPDTTLHRYNLFDSWNTARLLVALRTELQSPTQGAKWKWFTEVVQPLQLAVLAMSKRGLLVDRKARSDFAQSQRRELAITDTYIKHFAIERGFSFTDKFPNSDAQVAKLLFGPSDSGGCELKAGKVTEKGRASVDQDALTRVLRGFRKRDEPFRDLVYALFHRSRIQTILERYVDFEVDGDSRVRPQVKMANTKTWRFAYAEPALQQFPEEVRHYFVAAPNHLLLCSDFLQLEARWLAILASDSPALAAFDAGRDIHSQNACDLLGHNESQWEALAVPIRKASRDFSKRFLYRISYGGEGSTEKSKTYCPCPKCIDKVPPVLDLKKAEILAAEARWFQRHPAVRKFHSELISSTQRKGYYEMVFGVRRHFARRWGPEFERELKNFPMQASSALLMNRCQVRLHAMGAPIVLQHHDSFMLEIPNSPGSSVDQWTADLRGVMETPVPELDGVSFPVELQLGENWGLFDPSHPDKNPKGLRPLGGR